PLVVGVNGAQGSGKTTLVRGLVDYLGERKVATVGFSLDDIYLTNAEQKKLAQEHPNNPLLRFRGQPGTHDYMLGKKTLESLLQNAKPTPIPAYDKSLQSGYGDRVPQTQWRLSSPSVDVVLFEGWNLGFRSLDEKEFAKFIAKVQDTEKDDPLYKHSRNYSAESLSEINEYLKKYEATLYPLIDAWVYMRIADADIVYRWRKEQEDELAATGRPSLSDSQLEDFVTRFLPGYEMALGKL
ncbi:P-loop containing nucleoside triphosphate hydrolase protein, partial [Martensiomyces pterosporus]